MFLKKAGSERSRKPHDKMLLHPYVISFKKLRLSVALLFAFLFLPGCATTSNSQAGLNASTVPLLVMQKTPCYGSCPAYEATIMEDGSVTFVAWRNLPVQDNDTVQLELNSKELQHLRADIAAVNYPALHTVYSSEWTDGPSTYLTFYRDGKEIKRIKHQTGGPDALAKLMKDLDKSLMAKLKQKAN